MKRKTLLLTGILLIAILALTGCGGQASDESNTKGTNSSTENGKNSKGVTVSVDGKSYILPSPLKEFYNNGIKISEMNDHTEKEIFETANKSFPFIQMDTGKGPLSLNLSFQTGNDASKGIDNVTVKTFTARINGMGGNLLVVKIGNKIELGKSTYKDVVNEFGDAGPYGIMKDNYIQYVNVDENNIIFNFESGILTQLEVQMK